MELYGGVVVTGGGVIGGIIAGGGAILASVVGYCKVYECCQPAWTSHDNMGIDRSFKDTVFGQHLVRDIVPPAIRAHRQDQNPAKPLVLAFHGSTGTGKNYVSSIIANKLYFKGMNSKYVHRFLSSHLFPDKKKIETYRRMIRQTLVDGIRKCQWSLFIIDEFDKMPPGLIDTFKPYLDYNHEVDGHDFRKAIFIFMGNTGVDEINELTLSFFKEGKERDTIPMKSMTKLLRSVSYQSGGMAESALLNSHLIDFHVPFLPLERRHIKQCAYVELVNARKTVSAARIDAVADELEYFPKDYKVYSISGCKNVKSHVKLLI